VLGLTIRQDSDGKSYDESRIKAEQETERKSLEEKLQSPPQKTPEQVEKEREEHAAGELGSCILSFRSFSMAKQSI